MRFSSVNLLWVKLGRDRGCFGFQDKTWRCEVLTIRHLGCSCHVLVPAHTARAHWSVAGPARIEEGQSSERTSAGHCHHSFCGSQCVCRPWSHGFLPIGPARLPRSSWSLKRVTERRKKLPELRTAHFRASRAHSSVGGRTSMLVCSLASRESAWTSCPGHIGHIENVAAITTKAILEFMGHQPSLMSLRFFWQAATAALVQVETHFFPGQQTETPTFLSTPRQCP